MAFIDTRPRLTPMDAPEIFGCQRALQRELGHLGWRISWVETQSEPGEAENQINPMNYSFKHFEYGYGSSCIHDIFFLDFWSWILTEEYRLYRNTEKWRAEWQRVLGVQQLLSAEHEKISEVPTSGIIRVLTSSQWPWNSGYWRKRL